MAKPLRPDQRQKLEDLVKRLDSLIQDTEHGFDMYTRNTAKAGPVCGAAKRLRTSLQGWIKDDDRLENEREVKRG